MIGAIIGKRKVRLQYDYLNRHATKAFMAGFAKDATFVYPGNVSASGEIKGKKAIEKWFHKFMEQFPKVNITVKNIYIQNIFALGPTNVFAVEWDEAVTNKEGKSFQYSGVTTINIKRGKATSVREYIFDNEVLKKAWGGKKR